MFKQKIWLLRQNPLNEYILIIYLQLKEQVEKNNLKPVSPINLITFKTKHN